MRRYTFYRPVAKVIPSSHYVLQNFSIFGLLIAATISFVAQASLPIFLFGCWALGGIVSGSFKEYLINRRYISDLTKWNNALELVENYFSVPFHTTLWLENSGIPSALYEMEWANDAAEYFIAFDDPKDESLFEIAFPGVLSEDRVRPAMPVEF